jgi:hypothetical protein
MAIFGPPIRQRRIVPVLVLFELLFSGTLPLAEVHCQYFT